MNLNTDVSKMVFTYSDNGDQEARLTSITEPKLLIPYSETSIQEMTEDDDYPNPLKGASVAFMVDKLITISSQMWDEDNLERDEVICSANNIVHGYKFMDSNLMEQLGYTLVIVRTPDEDDEDCSVDNVWCTTKDFNSTIELLKSKEGYDPNEYLDFLESSEDFALLKEYWFFDDINSEWTVEHRD